MPPKDEVLRTRLDIILYIIYRGWVQVGSNYGVMNSDAATTADGIYIYIYGGGVHNNKYYNHYTICASDCVCARRAGGQTAACGKKIRAGG